MKKYQGGGGVPAAGKPTRPARMTRSQSPESHLAAEKARLKAKRAEKYSPESRLAAEKARLQANFENRQKNYINKYQKGGSMKSVPAGKKFNGLRSLPTDVRNKMGYAKYGSVIKGGSLRRSIKHK